MTIIPKNRSWIQNWRKCDLSTKEFKCPICYNIIQVDVCTTKCGHKFCSDCFIVSFMTTQCCPICRKTSDTIKKYTDNNKKQEERIQHIEAALQINETQMNMFHSKVTKLKYRYNQIRKNLIDKMTQNKFLENSVENFIVEYDKILDSFTSIDYNVISDQDDQLSYDYTYDYDYNYTYTYNYTRR